jgi:hypothetical protein
MLFTTAAKAIAVASLVSITGCASIVSKSQWPVTVQSNPTGAKCVVSKANGVMMHTGETPMTLTLSSSQGFFSAADYKVSCQKEGFSPAESKIEGTISGWYLGGNLLFGGLIGYLIVDPATGAMWKLEETMTVNLTQIAKAAEVKQPSLATQ